MPTSITVEVEGKAIMRDGKFLHLALPLGPVQLAHPDTLAYDITGEPMPAWAVGVDPEPEPDARAPPNDWDGIDPPAPDD